VPPYLRLQAAFSGVRLDCLDAVALAPVIDVQVAPGLARSGSGCPAAGRSTSTAWGPVSGA
jgi:hypothetical protein